MNTKEFPQRTILMVTNNYFPYQGGVAQSVHASTQALQAYGHKVIIVTLDVAGVKDDPAYVVRVPSLLYMQYKKNPVAIPWRMDAYLKHMVGEIRPDIIHSHHPWVLGNSVLKTARVFKCPVVFTHHTLYQDYAHYVPLPDRLARFFIARHVRDYCRVVDHIIAPSDSVAHMVGRLDITTAISVVPSAIRACFFDAPLQSQRREGRSFKLLYVGRLVKEKNVAALFDAVACLSHLNYEFDCVGYGEQWDALHEYAYVQRSLSPTRVRFHHKPDQAALVQWYAQADLFLFPSRTDTQGLVLAEAMACGVPVIALDGPGQQAIIRDGYNGYLVHTIEDMVAKICFLAENPEYGAQLSAGARITAARYTLDVHAQQLQELYEKVLVAYNYT